MFVFCSLLSCFTIVNHWKSGQELWKDSKYQVYKVNENNKTVPVGEMIDMESCVKLILENV